VSAAERPGEGRRDPLPGPVVDAHAPFGPSLFGRTLSLPALLGEMDALGIDRSLLVPQKPPAYALEPANATARAAAAAHPEELDYWCRVDPWQGEDAASLLEEHLDAGAVGLFLHPLEELFAIEDPLVDPLVRLCAERGRPVMVAGGHVRVSTAWQIGALAARFPEVTFVATSGGQINISGVALAEAETMLAEHPNVLMETSGIYREDFIEDMVARFGPERVVWGSGAPPYHRALELRRVWMAHLAPAQAAVLAAGGDRLRAAIRDTLPA